MTGDSNHTPAVNKRAFPDSGNDSASRRNLEKSVMDWIDRHSDALNELLAGMVRIDSQNLAGDGREAELAGHLAELYRRAGLETEVFCPDDVEGLTSDPLYWPGHHTDHRPDVTGVWKGSEGKERVLLAAHTDTMPVGDKSLWKKPPFGAVIEDGKMYGLGAGDDKAGLAAALFAVQALKQAGIVPAKDIVLGAYCDEEYGGGNGALGLVSRQHFDDCVNLDGSNYEMWATALGGGVFRVSLKLGHVTDDCSSIYRALQLTMDKLEEFGARRRAELDANPFYKGTVTQASAYRVAEFGNVPDTHEQAFVDFVIYTQQSREQIHAELQAILDSLQDDYRKLDVSEAFFTPTTRFFDYGETDTQNGAFPVMKECAEEITGKPVTVCGSCLTDLSVILTRLGKRCFNFGIFREFSEPGGAHQPDEYVELNQLYAFTKTIALFLLRYCM